MAFVFTGGFATVSSIWRYHKIIKFTALQFMCNQKVCKKSSHLILQISLCRTRYRMTTTDCQDANLDLSDETRGLLMRSDQIWQDLICSDEIWIWSDQTRSDEFWADQLDESALAEVVDQRGVHKLVLKQKFDLYTRQAFVTVKI